jgi:hypothetical protein
MGILDNAPNTSLNGALVQMTGILHMQKMIYVPVVAFYQEWKLKRESVCFDFRLGA